MIDLHIVASWCEHAAMRDTSTRNEGLTRIDQLRVAGCRAAW